MKQTRAGQFLLVVWLLLTGLAVLPGGCVSRTTQTQTPPPPAAVEPESADQDLLKTNAELTRQLKRQKQLTADLQLELLEKYAEVDRLTGVNERLVGELVRSKAKLRNRGDRPETVRLIAEVDTVITTVRENGPTGHQRDALLRAEHYLAESKKELERDNVEGASYLANQALEQVQEIRLSDGESGLSTARGAPVNFLTPLPMKVLETCNVRNGPSLKAKVLFVLGAGHPVTAVGYQGQWIRVRVKERGSGWIYYSLLIGAKR